MTHQDRINLIKDGVIHRSGTWAELGSGSGKFTMALADILKPPAKIFSVDKDLSALKKQKQQLDGRFNHIQSFLINASLEDDLNLPMMTGILMANSLHFIKHKREILEKIIKYMDYTAGFILVEYNTSRSNPWVPYPINFSNWQILSKEVGFSSTQLLRTHPSMYHKEIYSAVSIKSGH